MPSLFGDDPNDHPLLKAADNHNIANDGSSWYDPTNLGMFAAASAVSGYLSLANTATAIGRWAGVTDKEDTDIGATMYELDDNLGNYYSQNTTAVDAAGFLAGSILPGMGGMKIYNAGSKALAAYRLGDAALGGSEALGLLPAISKKLMSEATANMAETGARFSFLNPKVAGALGAQVADDYLAGVAYMGAATAALNKSPVFDNMDAGDMAMNIFSTSPAMLGVSAGLRGAGIFFSAKKSLSAADQALNPFRSATELTPNTAPADQIMAWMQDIKTRPAILADDAQAALKQRTMDKADNAIFQQARTKALEITGGDAVAARRLIEDANSMSLAELSANFPNLNKYVRISDAVSDDVGLARRIVSAGADDIRDPLTVARDAAQRIANGGDPIAVKSGELFSVGQKAVAINRATGEVLDEILPTLGDTLKNRQIMAASDDGLKVGDNIFPQAGKQNYSVADLTTSRMDAEARWIWSKEAENPGIDPFGNKPVAQGDLPLMERKLADWNPERDKFSVQTSEGTRIFTDPSELQQFVIDRKQALTQAMQAQGVPAQEIAQRLNVSLDYAKDTSVVMNKDTAANDLFAMQNSVYRVPQTGELVKPYMEPAHYVASYGVSLAKQGEFAKDTALGMQYLAGKERNFDTVTNALEQKIAGSKAGLLPDRTALSVNDATRFGAGGKLFSFSNGQYRSIESAVEYIGKWTQDLAMQRRAEVLDTLNPHATRLSMNRDAMMEFNKIDNQMRQSTLRYHLANYGETMPGQPSGALVPTQLVQDAITLAEKEGIRISNAQDALNYAKQAGLNTSDVIDVSSTAARDFIAEHINQNDRRLAQRYAMMDNHGVAVRDLSGTYYPPPVDPGKYPYFAMVRDQNIGSTGVSTLFGRSAEDLQQQIAMVQKNAPELRVITKKETEEFHRALADYQYDASINENSVNTLMKRKGVQNFYAPATDGNKTLDSYLGWHSGQETSLIRDFVNSKYGSEFAKIEALGRDSLAADQSTWGGRVRDLLSSKIDNPWLDYRRTALAIPSGSNQVIRTLDDWITRATDGVWNNAKEMYTRAFKTKDAAGLDEMNEYFKKSGVGTPYADAAMEAHANMSVDKNILHRFVSRANSLLSGAMLGFDPMNALNNHIGAYVLNSAEIKHIQGLVKNDPAFKDIADLIQQRVPGTDVWQMSPAKLIANGIKNFWAKDSADKIARFQKLGLDTTELQQYRTMANDLSLAGNETAAMLNTKIDKAIELGRKWTGNTLAEQLNRFISADIMASLTDPLVAAGKMDAATANSMMNTFVNRTHGNFTAGQRPQIFQGTVGSAISLYQTYMFNMMQQMFRYVGNGDKMAAAMGMGMQASLYGLNGLPGFQTLNNLIGQASGNPQHHDIFDQIYKTGGKDAAEWLMYGAGSNALSLIHPSLKTNLYSRGDLTPRQWTILPTSPAELPIVSVTANMMKSFSDTFSRIKAGADIYPTVMQGIEHMNLNRPLTGLAQVLAGRSTSNDGLMLNAVDLAHLDGWIRLAGTKPMNEAVALDAIYRSKAYAQQDKDALNTLGDAVRSKMRNGQAPSSDEMNSFMASYAKRGGNQESFQRWYTREANRANTSVINEMAEKNSRSFQSRYLQTVMGGYGMRVPDFSEEEAAMPQSEE